MKRILRTLKWQFKIGEKTIDVTINSPNILYDKTFNADGHIVTKSFSECENEKLTFSDMLYANVVLTEREAGVQVVTEKHVILSQIPKPCYGSFVIDGARMIVRNFERPIYNYPIIEEYANSHGRVVHRLTFYSRPLEYYTSPVKLVFEYGPGPLMFVILPFIKGKSKKRPLARILKALSTAIRERLTKDHGESANQTYFWGQLNRYSQYIPIDIIDEVSVTINEYVRLPNEEVDFDLNSYLPNLNPTSFQYDCFVETVFYKWEYTMMLMVALLRRAKGLSEPEPPASLRRVECYGSSLATLFHQSLKAKMAGVVKKCEKCYEKNGYYLIEDHFKGGLLTDEIIKAFKRRWWFSAGQSISVYENAVNPIAPIVHSRKVVRSLWNPRVQTQRQLEEWHKGIYCCVETPEGEDCGNLVSLATRCTISSGCDNDFPRGHAHNSFIIRGLAERGMDALVFVNGCRIGPTKNAFAYITQLQNSLGGYLGDAYEFMYDMLKEKEKDGSPKFVDVLYVFTDPGRFVVDEDAGKLSSLFGASARSLPLANHNFATRNTYGANWISQAISIPDSFTSKTKRCLTYLQRALVSTESAFDCYGINAIMAIMPYYGFTQEDAIGISKGAVDRGMFQTLIEIKDKGGYDATNEFVKRKGKWFSFRETEVGDKLGTRHGQKGVIGIIIPEEDMPFLPDGTRADVLFNPHCIPSRMTVGQLMEMGLAMYAAGAGVFVDAGVDVPAPFQFVEYGVQRVIDGVTGEMSSAPVMMGPTYLMKLNHMVRDKFHVRSTGERDPVTLQPVAGRQNEGGLKIGEMEKDAFLAHGATSALIERFRTMSDEMMISVCQKCFRTRCACIDKPGWKGTLEVPASASFQMFVDLLAGLHIDVQVAVEHSS